jgi:hypothetical protein
MGSLEPGAAHNSISQAVDYKGKVFEEKFKQATIGYTVDDFISIFTPAFPNHIKIDVDGNEGEITKGAKDTFKDTRCKSVLLELEQGRVEYCNTIFETMEASGLKLLDQTLDRCGPKNFIFRRV